MVSRGSFPGDKVARADPTPPSSGKVRNVWRYTSTHLYIFSVVFKQWIYFNGVVLVKHRDNFYLFKCTYF